METKEFEEFKQAIATEFSGMTIKEVLRLAELGKAVLNVDDLVGDTLFVVEQILKADSDLTRSVQYCLSSMVEATRLVREYENSAK